MFNKKKDRVMRVRRCLVCDEVIPFEIPSSYYCCRRCEEDDLVMVSSDVMVMESDVVVVESDIFVEED